MMQHNYPPPNKKQIYTCCTRWTHDALLLFIIGYHVYTMISGINPFGIL